MKVVIVYESMYGNTHHVANAIGAGFDGVADVSVVAVDEASQQLVDTADLLVVGGPTHVHGMSRPSTRKAAVEALAKTSRSSSTPMRKVRACEPGSRTSRRVPAVPRRSIPACTRRRCSRGAHRKASGTGSRSSGTR